MKVVLARTDTFDHLLVFSLCSCFVVIFCLVFAEITVWFILSGALALVSGRRIVENDSVADLANLPFAEVLVMLHEFDDGSV